MKACALILLAAALAPAALAGESARELLAAAEDRVEEAIDAFREARRRDAPPPADDLVGAVAALAGLKTRAAADRAARLIDHRDPEVARCAVRGLLTLEGDWRLLAGSLLAKRADYRRYEEERRDLYLDVVRGIAATGYLGAHGTLAKALERIPDGEVILTVSRALVDLRDERAVLTLFDFADWDRGQSINAARDRKHQDRQSPRSHGTARGPQHGSDRQSNRHGTGGTEPPAPASKEVVQKVYRMLFELMGREFGTWEELVTHMREHRGEIEKEGRKASARAREQDRIISRLGR